MSQLQAILDYQEADRELYAIERELSSSEERKKYVTLKKFWDSAPEKLDAMEAKAAAFKAEAEALIKRYEQVEATISDFENFEELVSDGADISFYRKKAQSVSEQLKKVKAEINALTANIKAADEEYQKLKKQVISAKKQLVAAKEAYEAVKASKADKKAEIEKKLQAFVGKIDEAAMAKYQAKRKEKVFPVFVELYGNRCSACSMDLPLVACSKLEGGNVIECDHCHRFIYKK
ncbi:MAG: hypothetical protein IJX88_03905 [Clostridia bacterium]|nr:hypothetical protein [Clostridia bacterium]